MTNNENNNFISNDLLPWVEKYRPINVKDVKVDRQITMQINLIVKTKDLPNIIFEGPPGVGKSCAIKAIARELYSKYYKDMVLELNASDDRGIKIQESISNFIKTYVHIDDCDKGNIPKFKMIILDEADNMTDKAKNIICNFIKNYSCLRFAFTCNSKVNINVDIQDCCHIIKYPLIDDRIMFSRLKEICIYEKIFDGGNSVSKQIELALNAIISISNGDLRFAINLLQVTYCYFGELTSDNVFKIHDKPHPALSKEILLLCIKGDLKNAINNTIKLKTNGYSGTDIMNGLLMALRLDNDDTFSDKLKIELTKIICYSSYNISKGLDSSILQITACVSDIYSYVKLTKNK